MSWIQKKRKKEEDEVEEEEKKQNKHICCLPIGTKKRIITKMIFEKCKIYIYIYRNYWVNGEIVLFDDGKSSDGEFDGVDSSSCSSFSSSWSLFKND